MAKFKHDENCENAREADPAFWVRCSCRRELCRAATAGGRPQIMQSRDGKTWEPAVPVSPREVGAFGLHYRIMFRVRAFFARFFK